VYLPRVSAASCLAAIGYILLATAGLPAQDFDAAEPVATLPDDSVTVAGAIVAAGQLQVYRFTIPANGRFIIDLAATGGDLDPRLEVYRDTGRRAATNDNASRATLDSRVVLKAREGLTYYLVAAGSDETTGDYQLTLTSEPRDDVGDSPKLLKMGKGRARTRGRLDYDGDTDTFRLITPNDGPMRIDLAPSGRKGSFEGQFSLLDADFNELYSGAAATEQDVGPDETYYVEVSGTYGATPADNQYQLNVSLPLDRVGNTIAAATDLRLRRGRGRAKGSIDYDWDVDVFRVVANSTAPMEIDLAGVGKATDFDGELWVYDSDGTELAHDDNPSGPAAHLAVAVRRDQTYYIMAAGTYTARNKNYLLSVLCPFDDVPNTFNRAKALRLNRAAGGTAKGRIEFLADLDMFSVTATKTGAMTASVAAVGRNATLHPTVTVYDDLQIEIAYDDGTDRDTRASFNVAQGQTYYLKVAAVGDVSTGLYVLKLSTADELLPTPEEGLSASVAPVDNSTVLTGYVTQDIVLHTQTDWLSAQLVVSLDCPGSVYQAPGGDVNPQSPNPAFFPIAPELEFDTYVGNGVPGEPVGTVSAVNLNPGASMKFDADGISIGWFSTGTDDTGDLALARVTLTSDASGTWQFMASASPAGGPVVVTGGTVSAGCLIANE